MIHKSYYFRDVKSIVKMSVSLSRRSENLISTGVVKSLSLYVILTSTVHFDIIAGRMLFCLRCAIADRITCKQQTLQAPEQGDRQPAI